jgi:glycerol uptake facilitator-like aquaporin
VGLLVTVLNIGGIPTTGASMNPARSFGPALISWDWQDHEIYWLGPFIGCIAGTLLALCLLVRLESEEDSNKNFEI